MGVPKLNSPNIFPMMVYERRSEDTELLKYRVLRIVPQKGLVLVIQLETNEMKLESLRFEEFQNALENKEIAIVDDDPAADLARLDRALSKAKRDLRERRFQWLSPILDAGDILDLLMNSEALNLLIKDVAKSAGCTEKILRILLRLYLQGGETKFALTPKFRGLTGTREPRPDGPKRGRPKEKVNEDGIVTVGVNVNQEIRQHFEAGVKLFLDTGIVNDLVKAFEKIKNHFFSYRQTSKLEPLDHHPEDEIPSIDQFRKWYKKYRSVADDARIRQGERNFRKNFRALFGNSTSMAFGSGSLYQADTTTVDCHVLSEIVPGLIIGRLILCLIVDVFSHLIVGFYLGLEKDSYLVFGLAFQNATEDKVEFAKKIGLKFTEDDWPVGNGQVCHAVLVDRGPVEGPLSNALIQALNISILTAAPYRADMKGLVESLFNWMNEFVFDLCPGAIPAEPQRGDGDYRLRAALTPKQLKQLIVLAIRHHNRYVPIKNYPRDLAMIQDGVRLYPNDLWKYGITNIGGALKKHPADFIWKSCLDHDKGSITLNGVYFPKAKSLYHCQWVEDLQLREQVRITKKRIPVELAYDRRFPEEIFLVRGDGKHYEKCQMISSYDAKPLTGYELWEIEAYNQRVNAGKEAEKEYQSQGTGQYLADLQMIISDAKESSQTAIEGLGLSDAARLQNIADNRVADLEYEREVAQQERYGLPEHASAEAAESVPPIQHSTAPSKPNWNHLMRSNRKDSEDENGNE